MTHSTADILRKAKALIDTPEKWTKGENAKDVHGNEVGILASEATCFCMEGALKRVGVGYGERPWVLLGIAATGKPRLGIWEWNDRRGRTHAEVMEAFDKAIALAEGEAQ